MSHESRKRQLLLSMKYGLFNRDPSVMVYEMILKHKWVVSSATKQPGFFSLLKCCRDSSKSSVYQRPSPSSKDSGRVKIEILSFDGQVVVKDTSSMGGRMVHSGKLTDLPWENPKILMFCIYQEMMKHFPYQTC